MRYVASSGERKVTIEVSENGHVRQVALEDRALDVEWQPVGGAAVRATGGDELAVGHYSLLAGGRSYDIYVHLVPRTDAVGATEQVFEIDIDGQPYIVHVEDERARKLASLTAGAREHGEVPITAPMPGLVSNVMVEAGQAVERGQTVVVLEAMKMENDLSAPRAGVVRAIQITKGQTVNQGQVLAIIGDPEGAAPPSGEDDEA